MSLSDDLFCIDSDNPPFVPLIDDGFLHTLINVFGSKEIPLPPDWIGNNAIFAKNYLKFIMTGDVIQITRSKALLSDTEMESKWNQLNKYYGCNIELDMLKELWLNELFFCNDKLGYMAVKDLIRRNILLNSPGQFCCDLIKLDETFDYDEHRVEFSQVNTTIAGFLKPDQIIPNIQIPTPQWNSLRLTCDELIEDCGDIPWYFINGTSGLIVAGGKMVSGLYNKPNTNQDVDFFIIARNEEEAIRITETTITTWRRKFLNSLSVEVLDNVINVFIDFIDPPGFTLNFQIIKRIYTHPAQVVHGFDIDICCILFDGHSVHATPNAARAIASGFNLFDQNKLSTTAIHRYEKYMNRYDLSTLIVGAPQESLDAVVNKFPNNKYSRQLVNVIKKAKEIRENTRNFDFESHTPVIQATHNDVVPKHIDIFKMSNVELDHMISLTVEHYRLIVAYSRCNKCSPIKLIINKCLRIKDKIKSDYIDTRKNKYSLFPPVGDVWSWELKTVSHSKFGKFYVVISKAFTGSFNPVSSNTMLGLKQFLDNIVNN